jgi:hypothetical protein
LIGLTGLTIKGPVKPTLWDALAQTNVSRYPTQPKSSIGPICRDDSFPGFSIESRICYNTYTSLTEPSNSTMAQQPERLPLCETLVHRGYHKIWTQGSRSAPKLLDAVAAGNSSDALTKWATKFLQYRALQRLNGYTPDAESWTRKANRMVEAN